MDKITNFDNLLDSLIYYLGDYDRDKSQITLYNVLNKESTHQLIKKTITRITTKYKYIILSPKEERTNVKILDIDI